MATLVTPASLVTRAPPSALRVNFAFLTRLRFGAVLGQLVVIATVSAALKMPLPLFQLGAVMLLELALNGWALAILRGERRVTEAHVTLSVGADLLLFSALLYFSGGPANPFNFLYLIHIALAALVLPPRTSFALVVSALGCSLLLFWVHVPLPHDHSQHQDHYDWHMRGMWVAFGLAACFIVYFIQRVLRELRSIEEQLARSRERATRSEAVAALAMLSAGAAHELSSPLSTIALASGELLRRLSLGAGASAGSDTLSDGTSAGSDTMGDGTSARDDVLLIRSQVERCRAILDQLAAEAGQAKGSSFTQLSAERVLERSVQGLDASRLALSPPRGHGPELSGSLPAVSQALRNLVKNALDASAPGQLVKLGVSQERGEVTFTVEDQGQGMPSDVLARALEPFFTTKPRGEGMGLGLFLAQSVAEQMGGRLELSSSPGRGTQARLVLPAAATNGRMVNRPLPSQAAATNA
jgi:two-component system, sensor histidine kinase RegB